MSSNASLNTYSSRITQPLSQGASQAMLMATGLRPEDLHKPQVGICSVWYEGIRRGWTPPGESALRHFR